MEYIIVFTIGASGYAFLEMLWRGYSHWTMEILGGVCFILIYLIEKRCKSSFLVAKCTKACFGITSLEFLSGLVINKIFNMSVWDYSDVPFNIMGQICPMYSALWFLLSIPLFYLCSVLIRIFEQKKLIGT